MLSVPLTHNAWHICAVGGWVTNLWKTAEVQAKMSHARKQPILLNPQTVFCGSKTYLCNMGFVTVDLLPEGRAAWRWSCWSVFSDSGKPLHNWYLLFVRVVLQYEALRADGVIERS